MNDHFISQPCQGFNTIVFAFESVSVFVSKFLFVSVSVFVFDTLSVSVLKSVLVFV